MKKIANNLAITAACGLIGCSSILEKRVNHPVTNPQSCDIYESTPQDSDLKTPFYFLGFRSPSKIRSFLEEYNKNINANDKFFRENTYLVCNNTDYLVVEAPNELFVLKRNYSEETKNLTNSVSHKVPKDYSNVIDWKEVEFFYGSKLTQR